jgi:hypothetical protein
MTSLLIVVFGFPIVSYLGGLAIGLAALLVFGGVSKLIYTMTEAALARLFRAQGRERILKALQEVSDPIAEAKAKIKNMGRTPEDLVPLLSLHPGQAHRTASVTYQKRNIEEGKCCVYPNPLAHHSVRYCEKHLAACRDRARLRAPKRKKLLPHAVGA